MKDYKQLRDFTVKFIAAVEVKRGSVNLEEAKEYLASSILTVEDIREVAWRFCFYANQFRFNELKPAKVNKISLETFSRKLEKAWWSIIEEETYQAMAEYYSAYDN